MLYVCIPVHNEATTIGVLLWRIRTVLQEYTREYEVVVYDDGSTDATAEVLEPYRRVLPLTVLRAPQRHGVAFAVDALCRHVIAHTRYPRRDAVVLMQGDFTDRPEDLPELAKRFEGGADLVIGRRPASEDQPQQERRLRKLAPWVLRPFVRVAEVEDLLTAFRLVRVSVLRDLTRARGDALLAEGDGWAATVDFALAVAPYARRVDVVDLPGRYDLRPRESRLDWWRELRGLAGYAWRSRGRRVAAGERLGDRGAERPERAPERPAERPSERGPDRPDVAVIGSVSALAGGVESARVAERAGGERPGRATRERVRPERGARAERSERVERPKRAAEATDSEAPRKRTKPRRAEPEAGASAGAEAAAQSVEANDASAAPVARPPRPERPAPQRTPRERTAEPTETTEGSPATEPRAGLTAEGSPVAADAPAGADDEGAVHVPREDAGDGAEPVVRKKARRRRRRSRGGSAANGEPGAEGESNGESNGGSDDDGPADGDRSVPRDHAPERSREEGSERGDDDAGGDADDGAPADGTSGEGAPRKRSRRRRRGRGRGERPDAGSADEGGSGTDAPDGVGERTTDRGVAPRASEPDPTAD